MSILISTPRLLLRQIRDEDLDMVFSILNQENVLRWYPQMQLSYEQVQNILAEAQKHYVDVSKDNCEIVQACVEKGSNHFVGIAAMTSVRPIPGEVVVVAAMLDRECNKGYATEAVKALANCGLTRLKFDFISALADINNHAANRVIEKSGFRLQGVLSGKELSLLNDNRFYYYRLYPHTNQ